MWDAWTWDRWVEDSEECVLGLVCSHTHSFPAGTIQHRSHYIEICLDTLLLAHIVEIELEEIRKVARCQSWNDVPIVECS